MAYNQTQLDAYRQLIVRGESFKSATCPYCNGQRDATVKHIHPSTKPADAWSFWKDVLIKKYAAVQSTAARKNMSLTITTDNTPSAAQKNNEGNTDTRDEASSLPHMFVLGPMVDQSELPFRMLCRQYGSTLAYTPMLHARSFAEGAAYRRHFLTTTSPEDVKAAMERGQEWQSPSDSSESTEASKDSTETLTAVADAQLVDRPCIVQFCGHDADTVLAAARYAVLGESAGVEDSRNGSSSESVYPVRARVHGKQQDVESADEPREHLLYGCDAVDLNLGCPQGIARRGHYGSFLMEDWETIHTIIHTLHVELEVPVTVKIRVFDRPGHSDESSAETPLKDDFDEALTILYARMIRDAGAQVLCVHGRTRDMKGQQTSVANMELIRRVRLALDGTIPVISNGNVYTYADVLRHLRETGCEGHMCAEPLLWDPALFSQPRHPVMPGRTHGADKATRLAALHTALVYMAWVRRCPVDIGFVKAHLFKMCFHSYELHTEYREVLGQLKTSAATLKDVEGAQVQRPLAAAINDGGNSDMNKVSGESEGAEGAVDASSAETMSPLSSTAFAQYVDAIEAHLLQLIEAEQRCSVDGEQPKMAQAEKARAKQEIVDVWEEEGGLGIDF
ncbi:dihydrouridine synthase (Dus) [Lotmaria passim]